MENEYVLKVSKNVFESLCMAVDREKNMMEDKGTLSGHAKAYLDGLTEADKYLKEVYYEKKGKS